MSAPRTATPALVLNTRDFREHDRWVTLLTPTEGRVSVLAKGVRTLQSKRRSALQSGNRIRCSWVSKGEHHTLTEVLMDESLLTAPPTLERLRDFTAILEVVYHLSLEAIEQPEFFAASSELLRYVGQQPEYHRGLVRQHLLDLAQLQGVEVEHARPDLSVSELFEWALGQKLRSFTYLQV